MALLLTTPSLLLPSSTSSHSKFFFFRSISAVRLNSRTFESFSRKMIRTTPFAMKVEEGEKNVLEEKRENEWGKVSAVLFDMDGVLCNSEEPSRRAAVDLFAEMGVQVVVDDFVPFMGTGEANFLGGVASLKGIKDFNTDAAKKRFFEIYLEKYAKPNSGIGFPGALELITLCKAKGLKVAVASSADRIKVDANLAAAGLPLELFDAIVSADAFENLKPAPDIFLSASNILSVPPSECIVIEDALAGLQAANAAKMRCIVVTTTLSEETLATEAPSLIKKDIGNITLDDILSGGSNFHNERLQASQFGNSLPQTPANFEREMRNSFSSGGLQASRRNILRYGSLGIAVSCFIFAISNWKAMQYSSPKALWNLVFGVNSPNFGPNEDEARSARVQQLVSYISDLERRGNALAVPEFPSRLDWLNSAPLQFHRDLKGKVVVLDFWTYCCINCMHVLPDLEFLEKKYREMPFVVVGVHSAKFDNEKDLEAIRNAVLRYGVTHPVVNDGDMYLWRELGVSSWPTFAVVGPNGRLLGQISGEGRRKEIDFVNEMVHTLAGNGTKGSDYKGGGRGTSQLLNSPWDVCYDPVREKVFIAMAGQHQIWQHNLSDEITTAYSGDGYERNLNGSSPMTTSFAQPSGMALSPGMKEIYIADSESSSIRALDLKTGGSRLLVGGDPIFSDNLFKGKGCTNEEG